MAAGMEAVRRRRKSVRLDGRSYHRQIRPEEIEAQAQPMAETPAAQGENQARPARGTTIRKNTGLSAATSLARRRVPRGVGEQISSSGASSAEMVIQAKDPAVWPAAKTMKAAPGASTQSLPPFCATRHRAKAAGSR